MVVFVVITLLFPTFLISEEIKAGIELELYGPPFQALVRHIDDSVLEPYRNRIPFSALEVTPDLTEEYLGLLYPQVKNMLTDGLDLKRNLIIQEKPKELILSPIQKSPDQNDRFLIGQNSLVQENKKLVIGNENDTSKKSLLGPNGKPWENKIVVANSQDQQQIVINEKEAQNDWQILQERWKKHWKSLSEEKKRREFPMAFLPADIRADLAEMYFKSILKNKTSTIPFPLQKNATEPIRDLFSRIYVSVDINDMVELKHETPVNDPRQALKDLELLSTITGSSENLLSPLNSSQRSYSNHHIHYSKKGVDVSSIVYWFNILMMLRFVEAGEADRVIGGKAKGNVSFEYNSNNGLVRMARRYASTGFSVGDKDDQFEMKTHVLPAREEQKEILELLSLSTEDAIKSIEGKIMQLLSKKNLEEIAKRSFYTMKKILSIDKTKDTIVPILNEIKNVASKETRYRIEEALLNDSLKVLPYQELAAGLLSNDKELRNAAETRFRRNYDVHTKDYNNFLLRYFLEHNQEKFGYYILNDLASLPSENIDDDLLIEVYKRLEHYSKGYFLSELKGSALKKPLFRSLIKKELTPNDNEMHLAAGIALARFSDTIPEDELLTLLEPHLSKTDLRLWLINILKKRWNEPKIANRIAKYVSENPAERLTQLLSVMSEKDISVPNDVLTNAIVEKYNHGDFAQGDVSRLVYALRISSQNPKVKKLFLSLKDHQIEKIRESVLLSVSEKYHDKKSYLNQFSSFLKDESSKIREEALRRFNSTVVANTADYQKALDEALLSSTADLKTLAYEIVAQRRSIPKAAEDLNCHGLRNIGK